MNLKEKHKRDMMRDQLLTAYKGQSWTDKVNQMNDAQVLAVYKRLVRVGRIRGEAR